MVQTTTTTTTPSPFSSETQRCHPYTWKIAVSEDEVTALKNTTYTQNMTSIDAADNPSAQNVRKVLNQHTKVLDRQSSPKVPDPQQLLTGSASIGAWTCIMSLLALKTREMRRQVECCLCRVRFSKNIPRAECAFERGWSCQEYVDK
jgi:hypothetical protein